VKRKRVSERGIASIPAATRAAAAVAYAAAIATGCAGTPAAPPAPRPAQAPPQASAAAAVLTGTVWYRERVALSPAAAITVQLIDVSRADATATVLGEQVIVAEGRQVPFTFEIPYDPARIDERFSYAVSARIEEDGRLRFVTDPRYAVITRGAPMRVQLMLRAVGARR
jgi:putative lipoprotein